MYSDDFTNIVYIWFGEQWQVLHILTPYDAILTEEGDYLLQEVGSKVYLDE